MVIVREVTAICHLLLKAAEFSAQVRDDLYKGSAELNEFPAKVAILSAKHAQWTSQLERFGMMEDEHLRPLVKAATEILDKEQDYVRRMQRSRFKRFKRRVFPGQLTYMISSMVEIVDAGRKQLEERVQINDLLERNLGQTAYPLPFGPDRKYVPLSDSITEVQKALEDVDGSLVVTVYGGPGMGKSSLVKYLALQYQKQKQQQMGAESTTTVCFPDGVFYLLCGRGAHARVNELQMNLLASLGGGLGSSTPMNDWTDLAPNQEAEFLHLPSHHTKLALRLAKQKSLIILDDVWEVDVLKKLLVPSTRVKYLVTSQVRTICSDATMIELKSPNTKEARKILANYTEGLPIKGELPESIQSVTDALVEKLEYHPLSLASVGTTVNRRRATDPEEWKAVKDNLQDQLDESDFHNSELVYGTTYSLTVGASMMLMVDSLRPEARPLLFLMGLLNGPEILEVLVKFFFNQIQPTGRKNKYGRALQYLEDRSLVEYRCRGVYDVDADEEAHTSGPILVTHGLRIFYLRQNHTVDMNGIATEIFSGGSESNTDHGGQLVQSGCTNKALATIMGAMYFEKSFRDTVATELESQSRIFNRAVIPRSMKYDVDAVDLMDRAQGLKRTLESLVWLLNPDGEGGWKQQAHEFAKKIVIRFTFRNELDDESMAGLIHLPHTTIAACRALKCIMIWYLGDALEDAFADQSITFSSAHGQTMKSLYDMCSLHDNVRATNRCVAVTGVLCHVLLYESEDIILSIAKKWVEFLAKDSNPTLQIAVAHAIVSMPLSRTKVLVGEFPGFLDHLLELIVEGRDSHVRTEAVQAIDLLCASSTMASKIAAIPGALDILLKTFLSDDHEGYRYGEKYYAGKALCRLSCTPENRVRFRLVHGGLEGLTNMLTSNPKSLRLHIDYPLTAARILANLAKSNEVRKAIFATFPEVKERLHLLQLSYISRNYGPYNLMSQIQTISRAMTILDPLQARPNITSSPVPPPWVCYEVYMGRVQAYQEMQMYSEALAALNIAHDYYEKMSSENEGKWWESSELSLPRIFSKAMLEDYAGAMLDLNRVVENHKKNYGQVDSAMLGERGVLKRLAGVDLAGALDDLDEALKLMSKRGCEEESYGCLKHHGLVKLMRGDEVGARADAEAALKLKFRWLFSERIDDALGPKSLIELPVNYLGFSL